MFIAIDNFYDDPDSVRNHALSLDWEKNNFSEGYPNGNAPWAGKMTKYAYQPKNIDLRISKLLGKNLVQKHGLGSGKFRLSKIHDKFTGFVHADSVNKEPFSYAGVLYLSKVEDIEGTILYRHKRTGKNSLDTVDLGVEIIRNNEYNDINAWQRELVSYIVYNRLVIYPGHMFHGTGPLFGDNDECGRLVQLFFWELIE